MPFAQLCHTVRTGWLLYLRARGTLALFVLTTAVLLVVLASGVTVFEIRLIDSQLPRFTPVWEILPVFLAIAAPGLLAPRLASWERQGLPRLSRRAATVAFVAIIVPAAIPWLASLRLPQDARWWDISCNVAFFSSLALIATALVGSFAGPLIGLVAYLSAVAVQQTIPAVAMYLPVSGASTNLQAHPVPAAVLAVTACCVWSQTLGRSRLVQRLHRND